MALDLSRVKDDPDREHITDIPNLVPVPAGILVRTGLLMAYGAMPGRRDGHV